MAAPSPTPLNMFFFSVLVMVSWTLGPRITDSAFSMCQNLDLEAARARRVQAVRGQILSKLQLETPPKEEGVPHPLPPEVMLLYNSTRERVRQLATCEGRRRALREDEEYYAKEVRRVEMLTFGHADSKWGYLQKKWGLALGKGRRNGEPPVRKEERGRNDGDRERMGVKMELARASTASSSIPGEGINQRKRGTIASLFCFARLLIWR